MRAWISTAVVMLAVGACARNNPAYGGVGDGGGDGETGAVSVGLATVGGTTSTTKTSLDASGSATTVGAGDTVSDVTSGGTTSDETTAADGTGVPNDTGDTEAPACEAAILEVVADTFVVNGEMECAGPCEDLAFTGTPEATLGANPDTIMVLLFGPVASAGVLDEAILYIPLSNEGAVGGLLELQVLDTVSEWSHGNADGDAVAGQPTWNHASAPDVDWVRLSDAAEGDFSVLHDTDWNTYPLIDDDPDDGVLALDLMADAAQLGERLANADPIQIGLTRLVGALTMPALESKPRPGISLELRICTR